jgi:hypothetical protein
MKDEAARTEWRSIADDQPPHNKAVLLGWEDWRDGRWCMEVAAYSTGSRFANGCSTMSYHGSATHWQRLPAPPILQNQDSSK